MEATTEQATRGSSVWADGWRGLRRFVAEEPIQALALLAITALTGALAIHSVDQPARCDESGTFLEYVRYGLDKILADYSSPNNHILHTLAAKVSTELFGASLWSLRLPALVAGVLLAPASYVMVRSHFGRSTALLGTALIATCPYLVDQATNARGYTMLNVAFMALLGLAPRLLVERRWAAWMVFALIGALGIYTLPLMGFPLAIVLTWMAISGFAQIPRSDWGAFAWRTAVTVAAMLLLAGLFYSPALLGGGPEKQVAFSSGAKFDLEVREKGGQLLQMLYAFCEWLTVVWDYATYRLPSWLAYLSVGCAAASIVGGRRAAGLRFFAASAIGVFALLTLLGRRPPLWSLSFLVLVYWTAVAVGFMTVVRLLLNPRLGAVRALVAVAVVAACLLNGTTSLRIRREIWAAPWYFGFHDAQEVSFYVDDELPRNERIVGLGREMITLRYYQEMRGDKASGNTLRDSIADSEVVHMIDSGVARTVKLQEALEVEGFEPTGDVREFPHSVILRFERVRERLAPVKGQAARSSVDEIEAEL